MRPPERLGPYVYRQGEDSFPLGQDTLLLGEFATVRRGWRVCDLGCGAGALPLLLLRREGGLAVTGVELDGGEAGLARANLADNGLAGPWGRGALIWWCPILPISAGARAGAAGRSAWRRRAPWRSCAPPPGGF